MEFWSALVALTYSTRVQDRRTNVRTYVRTPKLQQHHKDGARSRSPNITVETSHQVIATTQSDGENVYAM